MVDASSRIHSDADVRIEIVDHASKSYNKALQLRKRVLREPLGLVFTSDELAKDVDDTHFIARMKLDNPFAGVVGCLIMRRLENDQAQMRQVAVDPAMHRRGVGKALVSYAEAWAKQEGYLSIILHARAEARSFYEALDYKVEGEPYIEVRIVHVTMAKYF
jgi:N-acetylglutamate synthase-like GNAT family acetyltransferase